MRYDCSRAASFYDEYGEREWTRFADGRTSPISLAVHLHYLRRFVRTGDRVLDAGAGPGRFTLELARLGADVVVADVSPVQLELNRAKLEEARLAERVIDWLQADILDLSALPDDNFDAVVCYGGPLSYVLDRADEALDELLRVTKPGGHLLLSVMSLVGATVGGLAVGVDLARQHGLGAVRSVIETGNLPSAMIGGHLEMHLYRWGELEAMLRRHRCSIVAASASSLADRFGRLHRDFLSTLTDEELREITEWEIDLAADPGAVSAGEHIIAVVQKDRPDRPAQ
ncbi:MAG: class I SAM-dependent methyltransferase [Chloroflexi bacterium]|nr:class I SAM-dependent methyltransferase [Chloroflexota bacterium]HEV8054220.1 class I SAM-dependent methyltransferase [Candidatus Limnocylindrales bacterium]